MMSMEPEKIVPQIGDDPSPDVIELSPMETKTLAIRMRSGTTHEWCDGDELLGTYCVESVLGHGGMGAVYLVQRRSDGDRFAVKTVLDKFLEHPLSRRNFYRELRTWLDLPVHPHLTACRFFKTIDNRLAIFADFIEGGSLSQWINDGKIDGIPQILDIAIQMAWGLQAAHDSGVVHQDVKPANVLMTADGIAKITDFGLSRVYLPEKMKQECTHDSPKVSTHGMTVAYCSPEQAAEQKVTYRTDIWSWGASVLHMVTGEVLWPYGHCLREWLDHAGDYEECPEGFKTAPEALIDTLRFCFQVDPVDRWPSFNAAASHLIELYEDITGSPYFRDPVAVEQKTRGSFERVTDTGSGWDDPVIWLRRTGEVTGVELPDKSAGTEVEHLSRKSRAVADLEILETARHILEDHLDGQSESVMDVLMDVLNQIGQVNRVLGDLPGAVTAMTRRVEISEIRVSLKNTIENHRKQAISLLSLGIALMHQKRFPESSDVYMQALKILESNPEFQKKDADRLLMMRIHNNMATPFFLSGEYPQALDCYDRAMTCLTGLDHSTKVNRAAFIQVFNNKAGVLFKLGRFEDALALCDESLDLIRTGAGESPDESELLYIANASQNRAMILDLLGRFDEGLVGLNESVSIFRELINVRDRSDLSGKLANCLINTASIYKQRNALDEALERVIESVSIREKQVYLEGWESERDSLAETYRIFATTLNESGDHSLALVYAERAWDVYKYLASRGKTQVREINLASVRSERAFALYHLGRRDGLETEINDVIRILDAELKRTGEQILQTRLDYAQEIRRLVQGQT